MECRKRVKLNILSLVDDRREDDGLASQILAVLNYRGVQFTKVCPFGTQIVHGTTADEGITIEVVILVRPGIITTARARIVTRDVISVLARYLIFLQLLPQPAADTRTPAVGPAVHTIPAEYPVAPPASASTSAGAVSGVDGRGRPRNATFRRNAGRSDEMWPRLWVQKDQNAPSLAPPYDPK
ncbi:hypothetical protein CONLIGDRAFT_668835 [Coniochaeta ligniaria NRRL 30616]|uniref:Uncharacterized protein n=1 Tax=Coniochaeta ligniaria NRRL 30616 TaxID=1408157 RepID=A0A1J7IUW5_9PEZI|nr:hypothetical protein CONLIGDRAFT_668835 [Coniochaeta ligniaria NRRL 30616]